MANKTDIEALIRGNPDTILKEDWLLSEDICYAGNKDQRACADANEKLRKILRDKGEDDILCSWEKGIIELKGDSLRKASKKRLKRIASQIKNTFIRGERTTNVCTATTGKDFKQTVVCSAKRAGECPIDIP